MVYYGVQSWSAKLGHSTTAFQKDPSVINDGQIALNFSANSVQGNTNTAQLSNRVSTQPHQSIKHKSSISSGIREGGEFLPAGTTVQLCSSNH